MLSASPQQRAAMRCRLTAAASCNTLPALPQQRAATLCRPHYSITFQCHHLPLLSSTRHCWRHHIVVLRLDVLCPNVLRLLSCRLRRIVVLRPTT
jgi:hypothetical protein